MTAVKRIESIIASVLVIILAVLMLALPGDESFQIIIVVLTISLILVGIRKIIYYFSMARHMVGGMLILYEGVIILDLGIFTGVLNSVPSVTVMVYLVIYCMIAGALNVASALEAKKHKGNWKVKMTVGIVLILTSIACIIFRKQPTVMVCIYSVGLVYYGIMGIIEALKPTAIVYIQ